MTNSPLFSNASTGNMRTDHVAKRAPKACHLCHQRKLRCNASWQALGTPCSNCQLLAVTCDFVPGKRNSTSMKRKHNPRNTTASFKSGDGGDDGGDGDDSSCSQKAPRINQDNPLGFPRSSTSTGSELLHATTSETAPSSTVVGCIANVWTNALEVSDVVTVTDETFVQRLHPGTLLGPGRVAATEGGLRPHERIVYGSEDHNHSVLPHMTGHRRYRIGRRKPPLRESVEVPGQDYPIPLSCLPSSDWVELSLPNPEYGNNAFSHLSKEDIFYLKSMKNVLKFPPQRVVKEFMISFIAHVLPEFPVIDRNRLGCLYNTFVGGVVSSPLLFHSILYAASQYVDERILRKAGFESRSAAKEYFYKRTTLLYSLDCETEQLLIISAVLFISPWLSDYSEEKDTRYWVSCACKLVQTMGMHAPVSKTSKISSQERSLWRRIFWVIFARDRNISVGFGRPFCLDMDDINVEPVIEADFYEEVNDSAYSGVNFNSSSHTHTTFILGIVRLSLIIDRLIKANCRKRMDTVASIKVFLECQEELNSLQTLSPRPNLPGQHNVTEADDMWHTFLQINHQRVVALNGRYLHKALLDSNMNTVMEPPTEPTLEQARAWIVKSAGKTVRMFEDLLVVDSLRFSHGYMNTAIFAALVTVTEEIKLSPIGSNRYKRAANTFRIGLAVLEEMREYWSGSVWQLILFKFLGDHNFQRLKELPQRPSRWSSPSVLTPEVGERNEADESGGQCEVQPGPLDYLDNSNFLDGMLPLDWNAWLPFYHLQQDFLDQGNFDV